MRKQVVMAVALLTLFVCGCTKKTTTSVSTSSTSTFSITFNGKTISVTTNASSANSIYALNDTQNNITGVSGTIIPWVNEEYVANIVVKDSNINVIFFACKTNLSNAIGVYSIGSFTKFSSGAVTYTVNYGSAAIQDFTNGGKTYGTGMQDTTSSSVTILVSNASEIKGTFNVILEDANGVFYPATGNFDYNH